MDSLLQNSYLESAKEIFPPSSSALNPLVLEKGEGSFLIDLQGKQYIDFATGVGIAPIGHCHPRVVKAIQEQSKKLIASNNLFLPKIKIELAQKLIEILPGSIDSMFLCNSGTEAIEGSLKLARKANPGKPNFIAFRGGFHGRTLGALSITASKSIYRAGYDPLLPSVHFVDYPNNEETLEQTVKQLEDLFENICPPSSICAIIVEPILGEGGYIVPPDNFLQLLRKLCDHWGILLILDEVQTGFGRTGKWFACQHSSIQPDIIAFAKGIASGLPLGGFAANKELMSRLVAGSHGSTFGGNPIACAAALATIDVIESENLLNRVAQTGENIIKRLNEKFGNHFDIRGKGFMIGVELKNKNIDINIKNILKRFQSKGLIVIPCGKNGNVMRFIPPLNIPDAVLNQALSIIEQVLDYEILLATESKRFESAAT